MSMSMREQKNARAIQRRAAKGKRLSKGEMRVLQRRRAIQASWPSGSTVRMLDTSGINTGSIIRELARLSRGTGTNVQTPDWNMRVGRSLDRITNPGASNRTTTFQFQETRGLNADWSGSITLNAGTARPEGDAQSTTTTHTGGATGSSQGTQGSSRSDTSGGGASGGYDAGDAGGPTGSANVSGSSTTGQTAGETEGTGGTQGSSGDLQTRDQAMVADVTATITVSASFSGHWSDAVNPFKWGVHIGDAIGNNGTQSGTVGCGSIRWTQNSLR